MVFLLGWVGLSRLGDKPRQDLDRLSWGFLGQAFPGVVVEQKIEEVSIFFSQERSPLWLANGCPRVLSERGG